ncbi:tRNA 2'-phosphotransferase [Amphichorda felina]
MGDEDHDQGSAGPSHLDVEDKALNKRAKKSGGRGGRGGGNQSREVVVSRALSRLLRHQAENAGIKLDSEGYAPLDRVLAYGPIRSLNVTLEDVQSVVANNDKQRYSLKPRDPAGAPSTNPADFLIRANQGHSIKLESSSLLEPLTPEAGNIPSRVLHGTYFAFWPAIVAAGGLRPMGRNHVHCSAGTPEEDGVVSGMRRDAELLVEIDVARSIAEGGLAWWRSDNGVILTEGDAAGGGMVSSRFFRLVTGRKDDVGVLWEDGAWVADLPEGLKPAACTQ